jgi:protein MAK11
MNLIHTITHPSRLQDVKFCKRVNGSGDVLLAGAEDKKLSIYDVSTNPEKPPRIIAAMTGHANR